MKKGFLNSSKVKNRPIYSDGKNPPVQNKASEPALSKKEPATAAVPPVDSESKLPEVHKLPFGKVENVGGLPEGYQPTVNYQIVEHDKSDNPDALIITTIPPRTIDKPDPEGHSEWIVRGSTKAKVVNQPGYPKPPPKTTGKLAYEVRTTPDMGLGVFAIRDIAVGEIIFVERPLLVSPRDLSQMSSFSGPPDKYDVSDMRKIYMAECEKLFEIAIGRMMPEDQAAFKSLANDHLHDGSGPLLGITRTNGYGILALFDGPEVNKWETNVYSAVVKIGSRLNHSCRPNIAHKFDLASFSFLFNARRNIEAGEQLCYSYCGVFQSAADRQVELAPYGFKCKCESCVNITPETDKLRVGGYSLALERVKDARLDQGKNEKTRILDPILKLRQQLIDEGLQGTPIYPPLLNFISEAYKTLNMPTRARQFKEARKMYSDATNGTFLDRGNVPPLQERK